MTLDGLPGLAIFAAVIFGFAAVVTAVLIRHLKKLRILDVPNERSSHSAPTPRGGGLAIVSGFFLGILLIYVLGDATLAAPLRTTEFAGFLAAVLLIAAISLHDDIQARGFSSKLLAQLVAIAVVMSMGIRIDASGSFDAWPALAWLSWPLTLLWILGLTNAYNFMDGLDGMAGGTAIIASAFFALIAGQQGNAFVPAISLAICSASCGFLLFNWPPARIFMGDIGSTFLGFSFAALALLAAGSGPAVMLFVMPLLLLHFIFDTVFTFSRRLRARENVFQAHRSHLYQLLNRSGYSHRRVSLIYAGIAMLQGLAALWMSRAPTTERVWILLPFLLGHALFAAWVVRRAQRTALL